MDINKLLSYEYFGLLTDEETEGVNALRDANKLPQPYAFGESSDPQENLNAFKEMMSSSPVGEINLGLTDEEYADLFAKTQTLSDWFSDPKNRAMLGATVGGVVLPTFLPKVGPLTLPRFQVALVGHRLLLKLKHLENLFKKQVSMA